MGDYTEDRGVSLTRRDDVIAAVATPPGRGGVSVLRVSGNGTADVASAMLGGTLEPRRAMHRVFKDASGEVIDEGIALFFKGPASFTGDDTLELQGHANPVVQDLLLEAVCKLGARVADPGEFTQRAFLNGKLDLAQAEAVADLIDASSVQAVRAAARSLSGHFSEFLTAFDTELSELRAFVEAAIDFPEEEIDLLERSMVAERLEALAVQLAKVHRSARRGALLSEGVRVVLSGAPNVGKSSLLNYLAERPVAIVTDVPGTTRDVVRESLTLEGVPIQILDTAGLRDSTDIVEREGVTRAYAALQEADLVLWVVDDRTSRGASPATKNPRTQDLAGEPERACPPTILIQNKADLSGGTVGERSLDEEGDRDGVVARVRVSATSGDGMAALVSAIVRSIGFDEQQETDFSARRRHLVALEMAGTALDRAKDALRGRRGGELVAEDLKQVQLALASIVGERDNEQLLGLIFSKFCIGK